MYALVAATTAVILSLRYALILRIRTTEMLRYLRKSVCLALCYAEFGTRWSLRDAFELGKAAFLSCGYDVVTDWHGCRPDDGRRFQAIAQRHASDAAVQVGMELYWKDIRGSLKEDGLERGVLAMRCIGAMLGLSRRRTHEATWNLELIGKVLQIVDDVLDYDDDLARGEANCLSSIRRASYLQLLVREASRGDVAAVCSRSAPMRFAVTRAVRKAIQMLGDEAGSTRTSRLVG